MDMPYEDGDYVVFPQEAIKYLPEEWQEHLVALQEETQGVFDTADSNLQNLNRTIHAYPALMSLRYIVERLDSLKFEKTLNWVLENDTLILAFVTTYTRLAEGGNGSSGISKSSLPAHLRSVHESIIDLRNKRYAHNAGHESVSGELGIHFDGQQFEVSIQFKFGFQVGGAVEWRELVDCIDSIIQARLEKQLSKLSEITGREWKFQKDPSSTAAPQASQPKVIATRK